MGEDDVYFVSYSKRKLKNSLKLISLDDVDEALQYQINIFSSYYK